LADKHFGSCLCGEIRFEIEGGFDSFYLCHCQYCRKDTGSAHAANLFSQSATLKWLAGESLVTPYNLPSTRHGKSFCSICGSAVPRTQMSGALLVVPAGCLDTNVSIRPDAHLFGSSKADWDYELEKIPMVSKLPYGSES
jgi:hypothetical protein